ncbi:MAG TPA: hypothetical protein VGO06_00050 [Bosea sp. (in: a-proteobacteria)]|jgi:ketosteroid isomerase-like protein|uniref:YybH family protein n=1 Tax=Bosea sp. (in: a-proteobacteria) TaxID=1871050 RepID=UPI002E11F72A|nr:hypothetical protein [Bosea sp. (in: a-proteobacteria)]
MSKARTLFGGLVGLLITTTADAWDCARTGTTSPAELHREWIMTGWEKRTGDAPFDFKTKLGKYYDWSSTDVLLYDDLAPERRMARSAEAYGAMWTPIFVSQREVRHAVVDGPDAIIGGELATSTLEFAARLEAGDGRISGIRDRSTLVWRCGAEGWRIVREHNSSYPVDRAEIDRLVPVPATR